MFLKVGGNSLARYNPLVVSMAFGINLSKNDWLKLVAIVVVLAFVFEGFAINSQNSAANGAGGTGSSDLDNFVGDASGNATILSWDPGLVVSGGEGTADEIALMKKEGLVAYATESADGTVLSLSGKSAFADTARRLLSANATVFGYASVSLDNVRVIGNGIARNVSSETFRFRLSPVFDAGDSFPVKFQAQVTNGRMVAVGSLQLSAPEPEATVVEPVSLSIKGETFVAAVPWERRNEFSASTFNAALGAGYNATYKKRSAVLFDPALTAEGSGRLAGALPTYAISLQGGSMAVVSSFTDREKIIQDMGKLGLSPLFQDSAVEISVFNASNRTLGDVSEKLSLILGENFSMAKTYQIEAVLPNIVMAESGNYSLSSTKLTLTSNSAPTNGSLVAIRFTRLGRSIIGIERAQLVSLADMIVPEINDTAADMVVPVENGTASNGSRAGMVVPVENANGSIPFESASNAIGG